MERKELKVSLKNVNKRLKLTQSVHVEKGFESAASVVGIDDQFDEQVALTPDGRRIVLTFRINN